MKRIVPILILAVFVIASVADAGPRKARSRRPLAPQGMREIPCDPNIDKIEDCPDTGCSNGREIDPLLNEQKNIRTSDETPVDTDYIDLRNMANPGSDYEEGADRAPLRTLGEGRMVRVVAYAVRVSKGSQESCNCGLTRMPDKDNHIVLVNPRDRSPSLADEHRSQTAEFTPRVRLDHAKLKWSVLNNKIQNASRQALKVRVTGLLMFDSHHFFHNPLPRSNNWEIHPVFKLEFCPPSKRCVAGDDTNWVDLEQ